MLRVYLDDAQLHMLEVPISQTTTCADVIGRCTSSSWDRYKYHLTELWRDHGMWHVLLQFIMWFF